MKITVIITAYDRKKFILNAVKSALNQKIPESNYELIVVKNYNDKTIDSFLDKNGIKNVYSPDKSLGGKLNQAIEISTGEIIAFLEDDDTFLEGKLEYVYSLFIKNQNLVYYHNTYMPVNEKYEPTVYRNNFPDFNMSCISIRKDIIESNKIAGITDSLDTFMYLSAVESGKRILAGKKRLTIYMVHNSATNNFSPDINDFNASRLEYITKVIKTYNRFTDFFITRNAQKYLEAQITYYGILRFIYNHQSIPVNIINFLIYSKNGFSNKAKHLMIYLFLRLSKRRYRNYIQSRIYKESLRII